MAAQLIPIERVQIYRIGVGPPPHRAQPAYTQHMGPNIYTINTNSLYWHHSSNRMIYHAVISFVTVY
jgi:hypothetical protein